MYLKQSLLVVLAILGWSVQGSGQRRTTRPSWIESTTTAGVENEKDNRFHHQPEPQNPVQYPPQSSGQYPPQNSGQYSPQNPVQYPPQNSGQYPPQNPVQYPPQNPVQYPPQNLPVLQPQALPQYPPLGTTPILAVVVVNQFDNRYPDGSYEFRYELSDGTVRYERGYLIHYQHKDILVVKGYYSYRLPDLRYLTVYYTADQNGYRQDSSFSWHQPHLHRTLNEGDDSLEDGLEGSETETASATINGDKLQ